MKTNVQTPSVTTSAEELAKQAEAQAAQVKAQKAKQAEEKAKILSAFDAFIASLRETGSNVLSELAVAVGETVNKSGRPAHDEWAIFTTALIARSTDFTAQDRLFRLAQKSVRRQIGWTAEEHAKAMERFVKSKARGESSKASCSLTMAKPAAVSIALGE